MLLEDDPREITARCRSDIETKRDLIEWAQGIEYLRSIDPDAPARALGEDVVRIIAEQYADRPGWREEWRL